MIVSAAKTAELFEMPFGRWTLVDLMLDYMCAL